VEVIHVIQTLKGVAGLMFTSASANTSRMQTLAKMLVDFTVSTKQAKMSLSSPKESDFCQKHGQASSRTHQKFKEESQVIKGI
jgi:methylphosphotriester-DNA--protein-cysteine methyltransferase